MNIPVLGSQSSMAFQTGNKKFLATFRGHSLWHKDIEAILDEMKNESDRAVALVGASLVEHGLQEAIRSVLRPLNDDGDAELLNRTFGPRGLFAGLSRKLLGAFMLKIIGRRTQRDLELINRIRNTFAHDMNHIDFADARIKNQCSEFQLPKGSLVEGDSRTEYYFSVQYYSASLTLLVNSRTVA